MINLFLTKHINNTNQTLNKLFVINLISTSRTTKTPMLSRFLFLHLHSAPRIFSLYFSSFYFLVMLVMKNRIRKIE